MSDVDIQEDTHNQFRQYLEYPPYINRKAMETVLSDLGDKESAAKAVKAEDFMDMRFVAELEKEGFFKQLAAK